MHAQPVQGCQKAFRFGYQDLPGIRLAGVQEQDQTTHHGCHCPVAPLRFRGEDGLDASGVTEGHPDAGVHSEFLIQGKELAQEIQDGSLVPGAAGDFQFNLGQRRFEAPCDAVNDRSKGEDQEFVTAGKIVTNRAHGQSGFVRHLPEGCPFQAITGNDPEYCLDYFLAPGFGINNFGHQLFLARTCFNTAQYKAAWLQFPIA
ncbi:hypothetical protein GCM10010052_03600 [Paenarthrobacter histidinolovorans]|nr:hypothetical protein GCM10010052_03600 [Paenarthrobacter histidinolovorans]